MNDMLKCMIIDELHQIRLEKKLVFESHLNSPDILYWLSSVTKGVILLNHPLFKKMYIKLRTWFGETKPQAGCIQQNYKNK